SAPIVGTRAMRRSAWRSASAQACMARGSVMISMAASAVRRDRLERVVGVRVGRKGAALHLVDVLLGGANHLVGERRVRLGKLRCALREPQEIVQHQDLAVAADPRADADGRDAELGRNLLGEVERY